MTDILVIGAATMWLGVLDVLRRRSRLAKLGRHHTRLDYKY